MAKIFISYKRGTELDEPLARDICQRLTEERDDVFLDQESLGVGERWAQAIQQHLESCDLLIVLLSEAAVLSEMVAQEVLFSLRAQTSRGLDDGILPVRVTYDGDLPYQFSTLLSGIRDVLWRSAADTEPLFKRLRAAIARVVTGDGKHTWQKRTPIETGQLTPTLHGRLWRRIRLHHSNYPVVRCQIPRAMSNELPT